METDDDLLSPAELQTVEAIARAVERVWLVQGPGLQRSCARLAEAVRAARAILARSHRIEPADIEELVPAIHADLCKRPDLSSHPIGCDRPECVKECERGRCACAGCVEHLRDLAKRLVPPGTPDPRD